MSLDLIEKEFQHIEGLDVHILSHLDKNLIDPIKAAIEQRQLRLKNLNTLFENLPTNISQSQRAGLQKRHTTLSERHKKMIAVVSRLRHKIKDKLLQSAPQGHKASPYRARSSKGMRVKV